MIVLNALAWVLAIVVMFRPGVAIAVVLHRRGRPGRRMRSLISEHGYRADLRRG